MSALKYPLLVRNAANDICVTMRTMAGVEHVEVDNLRTSLHRPGGSHDYRTAAQEGLRQMNQYLADEKAGKISLSDIPYKQEPINQEVKVVSIDDLAPRIRKKYQPKIPMVYGQPARRIQTGPYTWKLIHA